MACLWVLVPQVYAWLHPHPDVDTEHEQLSRYQSCLNKVIKKSQWEPVSTRASGSSHCSELWPGDGAAHDSRWPGSERAPTLRVPQVDTPELTQTSRQPTLTFRVLPGRSVKVLQGPTRPPTSWYAGEAATPPSVCPRAQGCSAPGGGTWVFRHNSPHLQPLALPPGGQSISTHFNHLVRTGTLTGTWES